MTTLQPRPVRECLAELIEELLTVIGEDPLREGLQDTPRRLAEFLAAYAIPRADRAIPLAMFDAEGMDEMIVMGSIPFYSLCEHHVLPFFGTATIGYLPNGRIVGLSKLPRIVAAMAHGLQNQERITCRIADVLTREVHPRGVGVILRARHLCMEMRGVHIAGTITTSSALRGAFLDDERCRREFLGFHAAQRSEV